MIRIGLQSVQDIHVGSVGTNGNHLDDTLTLRVGQRVYAAEGVALRNQLLCRTLLTHTRRKVADGHPVQAVAVFIVFPAGTNLIDNQLVVLGDVSGTTANHVVARLELLHQDTVARAEYVVQLATVRIHPHLTRFRIVVVYLHHGREDAVVVLSQQLTRNQRIHPQGLSHVHTVNLEHVFIFSLASGIYELLSLYGPAYTAYEVADELWRGKIARKGGVASYPKCRDVVTVFVAMPDAVADGGQRTHPQPLQLGVAFRSQLSTAQPLCVISEQDIAECSQSLLKGDVPFSKVVIYSGKEGVGYLLEAKGLRYQIQQSCKRSGSPLLRVGILYRE